MYKICTDTYHRPTGRSNEMFGKMKARLIKAKREPAKFRPATELPEYGTLTI